MNDSTATAGSLPMADSLLVRLLQRVNQIDDAFLKRLSESETGDLSPEQLVIRSGLMSERDIASAYAEYYLIPLFDPPTDSPLPVAPSTATSLPASFCRQHQVAPLSDDGNTIEVALFAPDCLRLADEIRLMIGHQMRPFFATPAVIRRLLSALYPDNETSPEQSSRTHPTSQNWILNHDVTAESSGSAPRFPNSLRCPPLPDETTKAYVNHLFESALHSGATEIHLEPFARRCRTRARIGGKLKEVEPPAKDAFEQIIHQIKTLSKMETLECALPQEGVMRLSCGGRRHLVRVTTCPTLHGEKIMMRLGSNGCKVPNLDDLGFDSEQETQLRKALLDESGMILVTGPTGSGKSTTLYACLRELNKQASNIYTVEKQVAFPMEGLNQIEIASSKRIRMADAIRVCLRQDPDVLMAGELADHHTADACFTAASRGCFVMAGLETADSYRAINRVREMGIDTETISRSLRAIVSQRLLPRLCNHCKSPTQLDTRTATLHKFDSKTVVFSATGCEQCDHTGYRGHVAVFQMLSVGPDLRRMILQGESLKAIKLSALAQGSTTLMQSAHRHVKDGTTSLSDACRSLGCRCQPC